MGVGEGCRPLRSASKFPVFVLDPFPKNTRKYYENIKEQSALTLLPPQNMPKNLWDKIVLFNFAGVGAPFPLILVGKLIHVGKFQIVKMMQDSMLQLKIYGNVWQLFKTHGCFRRTADELMLMLRSLTVTL